MRRQKLTTEERELLVEVLVSQGWPALIKAIDLEVVKQERLLLKYDLAEGSERLVHAKARVEGAHRLRLGIETMKDRYLKEEAADLADSDGQ